MKTFILCLLTFLSLNLYGRDDVLLQQTARWLQEHPELEQVGLPATIQARMELRKQLDTHIEYLSLLRSKFSEKSKKRWLNWRAPEALDKLHAFTQYHDHLGELMELILARPTLVGMMNESRKNSNGIGMRLWSLYEEMRRQNRRTREARHQDSNRDMPIFSNRNPSMQDLLRNQEQLLNAIRGVGQKRGSIAHSLKNYQARYENFKTITKFVPSKAWNHHLYGIKSSILTMFGRFALPGKNTIDAKKMNELQERLVPGDIMVVNQDGRLSNVVFTGTWSHGIIYVGTPNQFTDFFAEDQETNSFYAQKCLEQKITCNDFESYLKTRYADLSAEYFNSRDSESPKLFIEAIDKGVITNNFDDMKKVNRVAAFAPKLSKLERARALEVAISNLGKPYDYNFDARTYDRLVCTELILYAYLPEQATGKQGLNFILSVVRGIPAMFAYNIVEAYFSHGELELKAYWESHREEDYLEERSDKELAETI